MFFRYWFQIKTKILKNSVKNFDYTQNVKRISHRVMFMYNAIPSQTMSSLLRMPILRWPRCVGIKKRGNTNSHQILVILFLTVSGRNRSKWAYSRWRFIANGLIDELLSALTAPVQLDLIMTNPFWWKNWGICDRSVRLRSGLSNEGKTQAS